MTAAPTILVVEDEPLLLDIVCNELMDDGFEVLATASGSEALAAINARPSVACLLTDIMLGKGPDGWAVAEAFRQAYPSTPVIYVSGYCGGELRKVEGALFVAKPYRPSALCDAIRALLYQPADQIMSEKPGLRRV